MKVLIVCHEDLIPPKRIPRGKPLDDQPWRTEFFVRRELIQLGHQVEICGLRRSFKQLKRLIASFAPDVVFNLLEEFADEAALEPMLPAFLKSKGVAFTGCDPEGLYLSRNKLLSRQAMIGSGLRVPRSDVYPAIVKAVSEDSSRGITDRSVVKNKQEFARAKRSFHQMGIKNIFSEEFIAGRELSVSVLWRGRAVKPVVFPPWEMTFGIKPGPNIATEKVKWSERYRKQHSIKIGVAKSLERELQNKIQRDAIRACQALSVNGVARVDFRIAQDGLPYIIEVNANPDLARYDELAAAAKAYGWSYGRLLQEILTYATTRN